MLKEHISGLGDLDRREASKFQFFALGSGAATLAENKADTLTNITTDVPVPEIKSDDAASAKKDLKLPFVTSIKNIILDKPIEMPKYDEKVNAKDSITEAVVKSYKDAVKTDTQVAFEELKKTHIYDIVEEVQKQNPNVDQTFFDHFAKKSEDKPTEKEATPVEYKVDGKKLDTYLSPSSDYSNVTYKATKTVTDNKVAKWYKKGNNVKKMILGLLALVTLVLSGPKLGLNSFSSGFMDILGKLLPVAFAAICMTTFTGAKRVLVPLLLLTGWLGTLKTSSPDSQTIPDAVSKFTDTVDHDKQEIVRHSAWNKTRAALSMMAAFIGVVSLVFHFISFVEGEVAESKAEKINLTLTKEQFTSLGDKKQFKKSVKKADGTFEVTFEAFRAALAKRSKLFGDALKKRKERFTFAQQAIPK